MKLTDVLVKPVLTEKVNKQIEKLRSYTFIVDRKSNKLEIKKAIEEFYGVTVVDVNTSVVPAKAKSRMTKSGVLSGFKPAKKKAVVTVAEGEEINLYGEI
jgi:large subunit ribosomal protein L23